MSALFEGRFPWVMDRSSWRETIARGKAHADVAGVGSAGWTLGNGRVFALRHGEPLTRLRQIIGPALDSDNWGSQEIALLHDGEEVRWDRQEAFRVRRTAITGVDCSRGDLLLRLIDCASPEWPGIVRAVAVHNSGDVTISGLALELRHEGAIGEGLDVREDGWLASRDGAFLRVMAVEREAVREGEYLRITIPELGPGEEEQIFILLAFGDNAEEADILAARFAREIDQLFDATYRWWQEWMADTIEVATGDVRLGDLVDDGKALVASQMGAAGVAAPLASRKWVMPVEEEATMRWLLLMGKHSLARDALSARFQETCRQGRFVMRLPAATELSTIPIPEPEWSSVKSPPAWTAASVVRAHWHYWRQTHDLELIRRHFNYLQRLVFARFDARDGLVAFGGDEPFYTALNVKLPANLRAGLPFDPAPCRFMRAAPWAAATSMALAGAAEYLALMATALERNEEAHQARMLAARVREAIENAFWMPEEGYYAAALSRIDGELHRIPHLPTALAPFVTGYATWDDEHAAKGLDETMQYLLAESGLPMIAPDTPVFSAEMIGELLQAMCMTDDLRADKIFLALESCASAGGEFRSIYTHLSLKPYTDGVAHPGDTSAALLGALSYLFTPLPVRDEEFGVVSHLPAGSSFAHVEGLRAEGRRLDIYNIRRGEMENEVRLGNAGPGSVQIHLRDGREALTKTYQLREGETHTWTIPTPMAKVDLLPAPEEYEAPVRVFPPASALVLTTDPACFSDWSHAINVIIADASMPISPAAIAHALIDEGGRRYDAIYMDPPDFFGWWMAKYFADSELSHTLARFRDLGGIIEHTQIIDGWYSGTGAKERVSGWISLPRGMEVSEFFAEVPWESEEPEVVDLLLLAADGAQVELSVNGEMIWERQREPEGRRARIEALFKPGENRVMVRVTRRAGAGRGFSLGIRPRLQWNVVGREKRAA